MAFDPENHVIDPATGFIVHKDTGHRVGVDPAPPIATKLDRDWPKWVVPHAGHIHRGNNHISTPHFPDFHVSRDTGEVTVLCHTPEDEARALTDPAQPAAESNSD